MIGIAITLLFGGFGAVMAWLSYARRDKATSAPAATSTPSTGAPSTPDPVPEPRSRSKGPKDR